MSKMQLFALALLVVSAVAAPAPASEDAVQLVVQGLPEGEALDVAEIVKIKLQNVVDGQVSSNADLLHPLSSAGLQEAAVAAAEVAAAQAAAEAAAQAAAAAAAQAAAEAAAQAAAEAAAQAAAEAAAQAAAESAAQAAAAAAAAPLPPQIEGIIPSPGNLVEVEEIKPSPVSFVDVSENVETSFIPRPMPVATETLRPIPVAQPENFEVPAPATVEVLPVPGELYNDGIVQLKVNGPQDAGVLATLQSWFSGFVNYISNGITTTQQIV